MVGKSYSDKLAASAVDLYNITRATVRGITLDLGVSVAHYPMLSQRLPGRAQWHRRVPPRIACLEAANTELRAQIVKLVWERESESVRVCCMQ